ncbi:MAG: glutamate synthase [Oscillospiraceae bacterium]|jgi:glutamate synthase domain-containing protein 3|nr:glutamate synthase [Oscillospiraceae bacterium]
MLHIDAAKMHFKEINNCIRSAEEREIKITNCLGQRYICGGLSGREVLIEGTPGNALGSYLNGTSITVHGNAQDATGDTMNDGVITIHGSSGDATGYAMRGGEIYVSGSVGYRAGIHMKAYKEKLPVLVIGGTAGCFLGEYQAGGIIIVLGLGHENEAPVGDFCATGMHGGKIFVRGESLPEDISPQVLANRAEKKDLEEISPYIRRFCESFGADMDGIMSSGFLVLTPDTKNPYKQMYSHN